MQTVLEMLARNAAAAALLGLAAFAIAAVARRPALRNALWLIVLARLFMPPIWSVSLSWPAEHAPRTLAPIESPPEAVEPVAIALLSVDEGWAAAHTLPSPAESPRTAPLAAIPPERTTVPPMTESLLVPALFAVWAAGTLVVLVVAARRIRAFERALRDAIAAPVEWQRQAAELAAKLGCRTCPRIRLVPGRVPPMLWLPGLRPATATIVLPIDLMFALDTDQRAAIVAHELAHLRRGDPWVRWLELLAVALYWWNPLLPLFRRKLRESEEQCCDAWVVGRVGERRSYATALVETVEFLDGPDTPAAPALASGAGPAYDLKRRLTMIMSGTTRGRLSRGGVLATIGLGVLALAFSPAFTSVRAEEEPKRDVLRKKEGFEKREAPRDRPEGERPQTRPFPKDGPEGEEFESLRKEMQKAREEAEKAMARVRELQEKMARLAGERGGEGRGFRPMPPLGERGPGDRQIQEMQRQIEEMRGMLEQLRRELRVPVPGPEGKGPPMFERKIERPVEPKENPRRRPNEP